MKKESKVEGLRSKVPGRRSLLLAALFLAASSAVGATRPEAEQTRIDWLLAEIGNSKGTFIRNGKEYDASRAASYLKNKLRFVGSRVQTVRDFIVGVASRSSESGKPYEIRLADGKQRPMEVWLLERLEVYEKGAAAQKPPTPTPSPPAGGASGGLPPLTSAPAATEGRVSRSERPAGRGEGDTGARIS